MGTVLTFVEYLSLVTKRPIPSPPFGARPKKARNNRNVVRSTGSNSQRCRCSRTHVAKGQLLLNIPYYTSYYLLYSFISSILVIIGTTMVQTLKFHQSGAIVKLRLRNFMTYNDVTIEPGPNLNMVIGPNGTGKSAIVCSIIVGLAGDVTLTGRANNITSLVQKGRDWASTEIELFNKDGRNHVIERKISILSRTEGRVEHKSEWKLNGQSVPKRSIQELITDLSIKVDNLCQFLPQDSVASFVKMNAYELLINTLKAAGDNQLVIDLESLVDLTDQISSETIQLEDLRKSSAENEVNARRLETEVEQLQIREQLQKQRNNCNLKIYYIKFVEARTNCERVEEELSSKENELRQQRSSGAPAQRKIQIHKSEEAKYRELMRENLDELRRANTIKRNIENSHDRRGMESQTEYAKFRALKTQQEQRVQQIHLTQQELDMQKCRLEEIRDVDYTIDINNLKKEAKEVQTKLINMAAKKNSVNEELRRVIEQLAESQTRLNQLMKDKERRLNVVFEKRKDYRHVCDWLAKHRHLFKKEVLLPMYCELNITNLEFVDAIEYSIQDQDLWSFFCQTEEDLKLFTTHTHDSLRARVNTILQPDKSVAEFEQEASQQSQNQFRKMDFAGYLKDMVEAPEPIMRFLCGHYNFHRIPIFNDLREPELELLMEKCPKFFAKKVFYSIQRSRYDQTKTTFNEKINDARLLKNSTSNRKQIEEANKKVELLNQRRDDLKSKLTLMDQESAELQQQFTEINRRCSDLANKQNERDRVTRDIEKNTKKLRELQSDNVDIDAEKTKLQETIADIGRKSAGELNKLFKIRETCFILERTYALNTMLATLARKKFKLAEDQYEKAMESAKVLEKAINDIKETLCNLRITRDDLMREATAKINGFKGGKLDKGTEKKFKNIPHDTVDSLTAYLEELKARIAGMQGVAGGQLLNEFNRQTEELRRKRAQIDELEASIAVKVREQTSIKGSFLSKLDDVIMVIDEHYQDFMKKLNYGGKIELNRDPANPDDFSKYGINIMVKYRDNEQLIPLSSTRQSGGERSVATMIYMLALQTKTSVPFRVVDEINQGMDKNNERKVFELLVRTADESSSQYFLVSPKLLHGLSYSDQMHVHVVFNGPHLKYNFNNLKKKRQGSTCSSASPSSEEDEADGEELIAVAKRTRRR